jgi:uncharacterized protein (TIGR02246 family)
MPTNPLPDAIAAYFTAQNRHDTEATLAAFSDDAVVTDEGAEHSGRDAIRAWIEDTTKKYSATMEPQDVIQTGDATDVAVVITGTFPGSPLELDFFFTLRDGKIAALATG